MDRRALLLGSLGAIVSAPALAQTGEPAPTMQPGATGDSSDGSSTGGQPGEAEMQHAQKTMQLGMAAMESSRIAMSKAQNEDLKRFAGFEVQEQVNLSEVLNSMMEPVVTSATGQWAADTQLDPSAMDMVQTLESQQAGSEFDRNYLQAQLQGHRNLLQVQEQYLQSNPHNREHMNVAKMARGHIQEHIALLESIQTAVR
jgi:putative membrane protein